MINALLLALSLFTSYDDRKEYSCKEINYSLDGKKIIYEKIENENQDENEKQRIKEIIKLVTKEMGADSKLFLIWAKRESKYEPDSIVLHPSDMLANKKMYEKFNWSAEKELEIEQILSNPSNKDFWSAKEQKRKMEIYKENEYWDNPNDWFFSYGLYSMNSPAYVHNWDPNSKPWVLCDNDGIPAIISAVWAARRFAWECKNLGYDITYGVIDRRFSDGHCSTNYSDDFKSRIRSYNSNENEKVKLGSRFPQKSTNREEIIEYFQDLIEQNCLTKEKYGKC